MLKIDSKIFVLASIALVGFGSFWPVTTEAKGKKSVKQNRKISSISQLKMLRTFCANPEAIDKKTTSCEDNEHYAAAAETCLELLDYQADKVIAYYAPEGQEPGNYEGDESLANVGVQGFDYLLELNKKAFNEIESYKTYFSLPEDADDEEVNGGNPDQYAMRVSCYGDNFEDIDGALSDIKDDIDSFESLRHIAHEREEHSEGTGPKFAEPKQNNAE